MADVDAPPVPRPLFDAERRPLLEPPGGLLMWIVVACELLAFTIGFFLLVDLRVSEPEVFRAGQAALSPAMGLALTLTLVTSGWLLAEGVHAYRLARVELARRYYGLAALTGLGFVGLKIADYAGKMQHGFGLGVDSFWDAYFLGTGFHFVHVLLGLVLFGGVGLRLGKTKFEDEETAVAGTALFWHMCDVAWFFLFPLFYAR